MSDNSIKKEQDGTVAIKQEKPDEDTFGYSSDAVNITLLGSMQAAVDGKKGRKRKASHRVQDDEKKRCLLEQEKVLQTIFFIN